MTEVTDVRSTVRAHPGAAAAARTCDLGLFLFTSPLAIGCVEGRLHVSCTCRLEADRTREPVQGPRAFNILLSMCGVRFAHGRCQRIMRLRTHSNALLALRSWHSARAARLSAQTLSMRFQRWLTTWKSEWLPRSISNARMRPVLAAPAVIQPLTLGLE